jgi:hypothetical protein
MIKAVAAALLLALLVFSAPSAQAQTAIPINVNNAAGQFTGTLNLSRFAVQNNQLVAIGTLTGTVTNRAGQTIGSVVRSVTLPVIRTASTASCPVLHLELGPLDLNLLGLVVHLDKVVLDITAEPGTLLGGLLCSLANIFQGIDLNAIVTLLNQILGAL